VPSTRLLSAAVEAGIPKTLLDLLRLRVSQLNGCSYCVDAHSRDARDGGEGERRVVLIAAWQHTDFYTDGERAALALAEAMTVQPDVRDVPDDIYQQATAAFTEQQFTAIAWTIIAMNAWNRVGQPGLDSHPHSTERQRAARRSALAIRRSISAG